MVKKQIPLLTIGIIFKNDIRSLEHCLDALRPLMDSVSCELVMADTGSSDGSRKIAARYADILFDFPWEDDFSKARNAVMDHASGKWYLTVDTDEYLDSNVSELKDFLKGVDSDDPYTTKCDACTVVQRNYASFDMTGVYSDFMAARMLRMSTRLRYEGSIHESWPLTTEQLQTVRPLYQTVFHHDGYVDTGDGRNQKAKRERNLKLLKKELKTRPNNILLLLQCMESSRGGKSEESLSGDQWKPEYEYFVRRSVKAVKEKNPGWQKYGAVILRNAVRAAKDLGLMEFQEWVLWAEEWFPNSFFTRIDVKYTVFSDDWEKEAYASCIDCGEDVLYAIKDYFSGRADLRELMYGSILMASPYWEQETKMFLAEACLRERKTNRALELLEDMDITLFDERQTENYLRVLGVAYALSEADLSNLIMRFWKEGQHKDVFYQTAARMFYPGFLKDEVQRDDYTRPVYGLFLSLKGECEPGYAASILLDKDSCREMESVLTKVVNWNIFPVQALIHALNCGVSFPIAGKPLALEEMEELSKRMSVEGDAFWLLISRLTEDDISENLQRLMWLQCLTMSSVMAFDWKGERENMVGMDVARMFARVNFLFLLRCHTADFLCEDNLGLLPEMYRLGWYCARAFEALDSGDITAYEKELKAASYMCENSKDMIKFLRKVSDSEQPKEKL